MERPCNGQNAFGFKSTIRSVDAEGRQLALLGDSKTRRQKRESIVDGMTCSIGIMAYNEEANIGHLLQALSSQRPAAVKIRQIVVVASGCTDRTEEIVRSHAVSDERVRLVVQEKREGKASAVNMFLRAAEGDIFVLESGDTIPESDTVEYLLQPFQDPRVGMSGARPMPVNLPDSFIGFTVNLYWRMHHELARMDPKLGEMIAFRNIIREIPEDTAVDEASIETLVLAEGYRIAYADRAIVRNKGAETMRDFIKQRRRVTAGHISLQKTRAYRVSTTKWRNLVRLGRHLFIEFVRHPMRGHWIISAIALEFYGRLLGFYDYHIKKANPFVWDIAQSTKKLKHDSPGT
jgi:biofilm PGA synthesis N-glycosyltransferase PgaC